MCADSIPKELFAAAAQEALRDLHQAPADQTALDTLAACDILVPEPDEIDDHKYPEDGRLILPVIGDPPHLRAVPVFTSAERMGQAFPEICVGRQVHLGLLAANWPADEDLALLIDPGHHDGLILTSQGVRALLAPPQT
ncbi:SseB family protein [Streptomyces antnestii]|uniref:SseB family protein n=1 Tax=Streptomyces antnestii TaxID=2494256 RepID=A0A3S2YR74_9ACTN|nr:SseB family protein [Streptomyces sp. San01]RVU17590.1 SseB family protein [Streptomyces sp. San01]